MLLLLLYDTLNFKLWFKSLFNLDIEDEQRVKDLIDGATKEMVHTLTNTKLKAIRVYMKAQKLQGGVRFKINQTAQKQGVDVFKLLNAGK